jgi:hypothetical protein
MEQSRETETCQDSGYQPAGVQKLTMLLVLKIILTEYVTVSLDL